MKIERSKNPFLFFSAKEKQEIIVAIQKAEQATSAEIRVHLEKRAKADILFDAKEMFEKIGMANTEARNGAFIFFCLATRRFAVIGDTGIHEKASDAFWQEIVQTMECYFREDRFAEGIVIGIQTIGKKLKESFPYQRNDINELPDAISYSL